VSPLGDRSALGGGAATSRGAFTPLSSSGSSTSGFLGFDSLATGSAEMVSRLRQAGSVRSASRTTERMTRSTSHVRRHSADNVSSVLQLAPGSLFVNAFRVVRPLSEGGMGAVYVVEQMATGMERALKVMHPQLVSDPKLRQRFAQEARIGARIQSEHVVQVLDAGVEPNSGMPWLLMELLRGETLADLVARSGPIPPAVVQMIFGQLCHAIGAAHAVSVVHRDLKPENIFLEVPRREGVEFTVKVLDFGIAKVVADASTRHTAAIGTPMWMAPEQTEARSVIAPAADVWALGLIAFYLLTGRPYWRDAASPMALMREVVLEPLETASQRAALFGVGHLIPPGFDAFFARCVVRDPNARFADARELRKHLAEALGEGAREGGHVREHVVTKPNPPPTHHRTMPMPLAHEVSPPPPAPTRIWLAVAAAGVLVLGGAGLVMLGRVSDTPQEKVDNDPLSKPKPVKPKPIASQSEHAEESASAPSATAIPVPKPAPTPKPTPPPTPTPSPTATAAGPLDKGALKNGLSAVSYKDCGTGGPGKVRVVFEPTGRVASASVMSGDYDDATKSCIAKRFKNAKVPPFEGPPVTVSWPISL
jgi:serine/threonine protein kinase